MRYFFPERNNNVGNAKAGLGEDKKAVEISVEKQAKKVFVVWTDEQVCRIILFPLVWMLTKNALIARNGQGMCV